MTLCQDATLCPIFRVWGGKFTLNCVKLSCLFKLPATSVQFFKWLKCHKAESRHDGHLKKAALLAPLQTQMLLNSALLMLSQTCQIGLVGPRAGSLCSGLCSSAAPRHHSMLRWCALLTLAQLETIHRQCMESNRSQSCCPNKRLYLAKCVFNHEWYDGITAATILESGSPPDQAANGSVRSSAPLGTRMPPYGSP